MAFRAFRAHSVSQGSSMVERITEEPLPSTKTAQSTVTCIYQANVAGFWRNVTVLWCKNLMNHSLHISIDSVAGDFHYNCKIDVKPWNFWGKKGYKSFDVDGNYVEVYWDLRSAKFSSGPEPSSDYYIALVSEEEVALLLGDYSKKAYKRTKAKQPLVEALLLIKKENVFAKKSFSTRACFDERKKENDIVVESSTGAREPEMWISIDGIVLIHVKNLQWKFRGNQTIMVNKQPVHVFWDVHDWLFSHTGNGHGLFIFKPGSQEVEMEKEGSIGDGFDSDGGSSGYFSTRSNNAPSEFCLFLYCFKLE